MAPVGYRDRVRSGVKNLAQVPGSDAGRVHGSVGGAGWSGFRAAGKARPFDTRRRQAPLGRLAEGLLDLLEPPHPHPLVACIGRQFRGDHQRMVTVHRPPARQGGIAMTDGIILATERSSGATLWTQDADFDGLAGVRCFANAPN